MNREELIDYLVEEGNDGEYGYSRSQLERMDNRELFDAWLEWHGFIGWTDDILSTIESLFNVELY